MSSSTSTPTAGAAHASSPTGARLPYELWEQIFLECSDYKSAQNLALSCSFTYGVYKDNKKKIDRATLNENMPLGMAEKHTAIRSFDITHAAMMVREGSIFEHSCYGFDEYRSICDRLGYDLGVNDLPTLYKVPGILTHTRELLEELKRGKYVNGPDTVTSWCTLLAVVAWTRVRPRLSKNRKGFVEEATDTFCRMQGADVLLKLPEYARAVAKALRNRNRRNTPGFKYLMGRCYSSTQSLAAHLDNLAVVAVQVQESDEDDNDDYDYNGYNGWYEGSDGDGGDNEEQLYD
ncbi:Uu.00g093010.m01.CDS01 [Anthostomella pinea]|uniref:Uu.00g093010.m01.CDS01 n=1 Tax=Anthostomella pinea TaxID=933095 RepID=A0AAI8YKI3_9PEZI|nr:Uu.00g093010.m01.CDS01 [Anthostomella pinea]